MKKPHKSSSPATGNKDAMLSNIALLYYGEGLTQSEIAKRFKLSRATIVNMLRECREREIVDIRVDGRLLSASSLARDLREHFGLDDVYVSMDCHRDDTPAHKDQLEQLARVGAMALLDIVEAGDRIGVAWGETVAAVAKALPRQVVEATEVCQLIGPHDSGRVPASEYCAIEVANKLGARCYTLHAPGIVSSQALAEQLKKEATLATQLGRLEALNMTVASIGNVGDETHMLAAGIASDADLLQARALGAKGILCCRFIDETGQEILCPPQERLIAVSLEHINAARKKLLIVCGKDRLEATRAAIAGGLVTHLVVDQVLAEALMAVGPQS